MFPEDMIGQRKRLLDALTLVVANLHSPQTVRPRLEQLGHAHLAYGARTTHYPLVCDALVTAMSEVAGADWTPELQLEWTRAISLVSEIMIRGAEALDARSRVDST